MKKALKLICTQYKKGNEEMQIRENVSKYIKESGYKQEYIAKKIGISPQALSAVVHGRRELGLEEYIKTCDFFGVPYDFFYLIIAQAFKSLGETVMNGASFPIHHLT